ncbi:hypothetical protein [Secundilactobacillus collinoides]|uniref:hypothetical protein n=1 Tax=Secundilactobacillus collinoides TaxID=33960 RepID=UPI0006D0A1FD|nr:hypothetical protein [Secundilactobacillus collinoides]
MWRKATKGATNYFVILLVVDVIFEPLSLIFKHHSNGLLGLFISILRAKKCLASIGELFGDSHFSVVSTGTGISCRTKTERLYGQG